VSEQVREPSGESVLFALARQGAVLCEWRDWSHRSGGKPMHSIPGGKVAPQDRRVTDCQAAALRRELREEMGVVPLRYARIGEVWYDNFWLFHVYLISDWQGEPPAYVKDTGRPLRWIAAADLRDAPVMIGVSDLIRKHLEGGGFR